MYVPIVFYVDSMGCDSGCRLPDGDSLVAILVLMPTEFALRILVVMFDCNKTLDGITIMVCVKSKCQT